MMERNKNKMIVVNKSEVYNISEDLIMEIILRLPPISVVRFKQVSKTWYSLISNPDFLRTHSSSYLQFYKHSNDQELMISRYLHVSKQPLMKLFSSPPPSSVEFLNELLHSCPINSCNGLLLLPCKSNSNTYYVCNPVNKHYVKIPKICRSIIPKNENFKFLTYPLFPFILFDPTTSLSYKLIKCLVSRTKIDKGFSEFYVYSSETGSWRFVKTFPFQLIYANPAVLLNGMFYWNTCHGTDNLLCFDLEKECVSLLKLPPKPIGYSSRQCFYFGKCDGRLRLIEKYCVFNERISYLTFPCSFDIMETEPQQQQQQDGTLTWSVKYHVNIETGYDHLIINQPSVVSIIHLYIPKNKGEEETLLLNINGEIVPFTLKSNTFGKAATIQNTTHLPHFSDFKNTFPYITTLFPLL